MRNLHRLVPVALALGLASLSSSCGLLWHNRPILRHGRPVATAILNSTRDQLNQRITNLYNAISSFQANVDMTPSVGSVYKGQITEIKDVRAFVLFRKPYDIRIIGLLPIVRTKAFDMVSDGSRFRFFLSSKNLFVEGDNNAPAVSKNQIENLRPDAFLSSMLIRPADPETESIMLEDATDEENALYILHFVRKKSSGEFFLFRNVWFDRVDLSIVRQKVMDEDGLILSDTRYSKWQPYSGVSFPAHIDINRPKDGYGVVIDVTQMQMNKEMNTEQFALPRPEGSQLQTIGAPVIQEPHQ